VKSTPTRGVKQYLKPDAYKQSKRVLKGRMSSTDQTRNQVI